MTFLSLRKKITALILASAACSLFFVSACGGNFKNEYNVVLYESPAIESYAYSINLIQSKAELDELYTEAVKTEYRERTGGDFDTDFPFCAIDFSKRMLIVHFLDPFIPQGNSFVLESVELNDFNDAKSLAIRYTVIGKKRPLMCLIAELDKIPNVGHTTFSTYEKTA
ncbi:MAG: hypothetical protein FWD58_07980 [Firmicutes bacterium]|nr:hypothetical protein [Bacillota bacterium]